MRTIIKEGLINRVVECKRCKCTYTFDGEDVQYAYICDGKKMLPYTECPACDDVNEVTFKSEEEANDSVRDSDA